MWFCEPELPRTSEHLSEHVCDTDWKSARRGVLKKGKRHWRLARKRAWENMQQLYSSPNRRYLEVRTVLVSILLKHFLFKISGSTYMQLLEFKRSDRWVALYAVVASLKPERCVNLLLKGNNEHLTQRSQNAVTHTRWTAREIQWSGIDSHLWDNQESTCWLRLHN